MKQSTRKMALLGMLAALALAPTLRAEEATSESSMADEAEEMRVQLGALSSQMNDLKKMADEMPKIGINVDLRYDKQTYNTGTIANSASAPVLFTQNPTPNGKAGMYAKRVEFEFKGKISSWAQYHLQFEAAGLKLEDLGVELNGLSLLPFVSTGSYTADVKIGQFRQPFGVEPQTGSSSTPFPERALMYGGANPFNGTYATAKLVTERVMGLHFKHAHGLGPIAYEIAFAIADDENDQASGVSAISATQAVDQDPSEMGRLGLNLVFLNDMLKDILAVKFGASAMHDSLNTAFMSSSPATQAWADNIGWDATIDVLKNWHLLGEWVSRNSFTATAGLTKRQEGWYLLSTMEPLKWFDADAPKIEWNTRYEGFLPDVDRIGAATNLFATSDNAITTGVKWSFVGKNYTSVNYTVYGLGNNFGALAGTELWTIQQQFNY